MKGFSMKVTQIQQRGMFFLFLQEKYDLSQKQIKEYCIKEYEENFSLSTISRGISEAKLIDKVQIKEIMLRESVPEVNAELIAAILGDSCIRKYRKS